VAFDAQWRNELELLKDSLASHVDWKRPEASPFISTYSYPEAALAEALHRRYPGKTNAVIIYIDVTEVHVMVQYRKACKLADEVRVPIPPGA
jgi:hypothetical protein